MIFGPSVFFWNRGPITYAEKFSPLMKHLYATGLRQADRGYNRSLFQKNIYKYVRYIVIKSRFKNTWLTIVDPDGTTAFGTSFGALGFHTKKSRKNLRLPIQLMFEKFRLWFHHDFSTITRTYYHLKFKTPITKSRARSYTRFWLNKAFSQGRNPTVMGKIALQQTRLNRLRSLLNFNEQLITSGGPETVESSFPLLLGLPLLLRLRYTRQRVSFDNVW
jgi:hypothetical protein